MTIDAVPETGEMRCARHPKVTTQLSCGRCGTPICPKCMVMTDVGGRCPTCAPARKLPQFEIGPLYVLRGAAAALVAGALLGGIWGALLSSIGFLSIFLGIAIGYGVAEPVSWATNRKSGPPLQVAGAAGVILAYVVRNIVAGNVLIPGDDLYGYIVVVVAFVVAINHLRY